MADTVVNTEILALVTATLVTVGRIAVGAHYPSDDWSPLLLRRPVVTVLLLAAGPVQRLLDHLLPGSGPEGPSRLINAPASWDGTGN
ncbi:MAG: hypothetical protein M3066_18870 [Actinomycetota bacterium]|nr:hypothetical protein [Actinomycetota bacterium]